MSHPGKPDGISKWQSLWGSPRDLFFESEGHELEIAFALALLFHAIPFSYLWKTQAIKKTMESITLQSVDLMEPEIERPAAPPVEVEKPKSAFDFLKMALPIFKKAEAPRDIVLTQKIQEPKLAEPEKLIGKKLPPGLQAPEIKLDAKNAAAPKIADLAKLPQFKTAEPRNMEPALKLEEVGRKAAPQIQAPALSLDSKKGERVADISALPKVAQVASPRSSSLFDKLVDKVAPALTSKPSAPVGYQRRDIQEPVSLDKPREVERSLPKVVAQPVVQVAKSTPKIEISKEKVKITGPLSARKVIQSYIPEYPAWARSRNIEADVSIRFTVTPQGSVIDRPVVERTSGFPELDRLALEALKKWRFSLLSGSDQEQWGVITFRFLMD